MKLHHHGFEVGCDRRSFCPLNVAIWSFAAVSALATAAGLGALGFFLLGRIFG